MELWSVRFYFQWWKKAKIDQEMRVIVENKVALFAGHGVDATFLVFHCQ